MPSKRNEIGKIQNSKLYKPQMKNCAMWTHVILHLHAFYWKIFNREFNISSAFTFTIILFPQTCQLTNNRFIRLFTELRYLIYIKKQPPIRIQTQKTNLKESARDEFKGKKQLVKHNS